MSQRVRRPGPAQFGRCALRVAHGIGGRVGHREVMDVEELVDAFERHLALERSTSPHTRRAHRGDIESLFGYLEVHAPPARSTTSACPSCVPGLPIWPLPVLEGDAGPARGRHTELLPMGGAHRTGPERPRIATRRAQAAPDPARVLSAPQAGALLDVAALAADDGVRPASGCSDPRAALCHRDPGR